MYLSPAQRRGVIEFKKTRQDAFDRTMADMPQLFPDIFRMTRGLNMADEQTLPGILTQKICLIRRPSITEVPWCYDVSLMSKPVVRRHMTKLAECDEEAVLDMWQKSRKEIVIHAQLMFLRSIS